MAKPTYPFASALVTGASSGIGAEITRQLRARDIPVVAVARRTDRLAAMATELGGIEVLTADLATRDGQNAVADRIRDTARPIDLVVNNAGFGSSGGFVDVAADRLAAEIEVNIAALTRLSHAALSVMVPRQRGWLLNVSSVISFQPAPRLAVYAATKAYVTSLTESIREEVKKSGVKVTALCPGRTPTEFQSVSNPRASGPTRPRFMWTAVEQVAAIGLADVANGRAVSVPGVVYKVIAGVSSVTPRSVLRIASNFVPGR